MPPIEARRSQMRGTWKRRIDPAWPGTIISVSVSSGCGPEVLDNGLAPLGRGFEPHPQDELSHPELVSVRERSAMLARTVHQRAVRAAEVLHERLAGVVPEQRVGARDRGFVQHQVGVAAATDHRARAIELPLQ